MNTTDVMEYTGAWRQWPRWDQAMEVALTRARMTGYRYRVWRSYALPGVWLVTRVLPRERIGSRR